MTTQLVQSPKVFIKQISNVIHNSNTKDPPLWFKLGNETYQSFWIQGIIVHISTASSLVTLDDGTGLLSIECPFEEDEKLQIGNILSVIAHVSTDGKVMAKKFCNIDEPGASLLWPLEVIDVQLANKK